MQLQEVMIIGVSIAFMATNKTQFFGQVLIFLLYWSNTTKEPVLLGLLISNQNWHSGYLAK